MPKNCVMLQSAEIAEDFGDCELKQPIAVLLN